MLPRSGLNPDPRDAGPPVDETLNNFESLSVNSDGNRKVPTPHKTQNITVKVRWMPAGPKDPTRHVYHVRPKGVMIGFSCCLVAHL